MKICVLTLGCKVNQYESDSMILALKNKGYEVFCDFCFADVYIINSCAVTSASEKKSRQFVSKCISHNKDAKIVVCGCASQNNPKQFEKDGVTYICGISNKMSIIENLLTKQTNIFEHSTEYLDEYIAKPSKTRAYVKVQDGCNNFCSYCLIPYLRGRSRSRKLESVLKEIEFQSEFAKEIVITGIDISDYKVDGEYALDKILDGACKNKNIRVRIGSLEQGIVTDKFLQSCNKENVCKHFHLSLQSGCDSVLQRMNRKYLTADYLAVVKKIKEKFEDANITTDIIIGFPEETEEEFLQTYNFAKEVGFSNLHIFPYSRRAGTVACKLKDVQDCIKKERVTKMLELSNKLHSNFMNKSLNKEHIVLIEEHKDGYSVGYTGNYIKCYIKGDFEKNEFVKVCLKSVYKDGALGVLVE